MGADLFGLPMRLALYASDLCVIGACAVFAVTVGTGWSWALFVWAVAIGALGTFGAELFRKVAVSRSRLTPEQLTAIQARVTARRLAVVPAGLAMSVAIGLIAGSLEAPWIDVAYAVAMLLLLALPVLIALVILKRGRAKDTPST
jgi:hypothetical protein